MVAEYQGLQMFEALHNAMTAAGIDPAHAPMIADGQLRRFRLPEDRLKSKNGYITVFDNGDGSHGASFGSWKYNIKETWFSGKVQQQTTSAERTEFSKRMVAAKRKQAEQQKQRHVATAVKATRLWRRAQPAAANHPYLIKKQIRPHGLRQINSSLVVPVRTTAGELTGLQFIQSDGSKKFLSGTAVAGCYHAIGNPPSDVLLLAEGFATSATLTEASGYPCAVAFFAGNLRPVALALRSKYPAVQMIFCADADHTGRTAAAQAAAAVNGLVVEPEFNEKESIAHG